jgi:hypothetical protein
MNPYRHTLLALACCALWSASAAAEPKAGPDPAAAQALRKAQGMLRQLSQERADLEAKVAELTASQDVQLKTIDELKGKIKALEPLQALPAQIQQQKASLDAMQASNAALQQRISGDADRIRGGMDQQRKLAAELEQFRRDNALLVHAVAERTEWIQACTGKNEALLKANRDWLDKNGNKKLWDEIAEAEPFTGIAAVTQENKVEEFRYKLGDLEVTPWREPPAAAEPPPATAEEATPPEPAAPPSQPSQ